MLVCAGADNFFSTTFACAISLSLLPKQPAYLRLDNERRRMAACRRALLNLIWRAGD